MKIWDFIIGILMKITKSQIWVSRKFFSENIFHRKKSFSRKFLVFLQQHTLGSYLTQYDHPTPKTREVRSLEKNCFTFFNLRLDILDDLRSDNDMYTHPHTHTQGKDWWKSKVTKIVNHKILIVLWKTIANKFPQGYISSL